ncbi:MAG: hypothetical protein IJ512_07150 [Ruminococcus sp.]|nr:hypothetical protein [Ruminococcus sp.]
MQKNNLPSGWGQSSQKPQGWGQPSVPEHAHLPENHAAAKSHKDNAPVKEAALPEVQEKPVQVQSASGPKEIPPEQTEKAPASPKETSRRTADPEKKNTNTPIIILTVLLILVLAALGILAYLYFSEAEPTENAVSGSGTGTVTLQAEISHTEITKPVLTNATASTTAPSSTAATTTTTTAAATTVPVSTTEPAPSALYLWTEDRTYDAKAVSELSVYSQPDPASDIISTLKKNTAFQVDSYSVKADGTVWFRLGGDNGWIRGTDIECAYADCFTLMQGIAQYDTLCTSNTFAHYDINGDGTDEWLFQTGAYTAEMAYSIYTAKAYHLQYAGSIINGMLYTEANGQLLVQYARMGVEEVYAVTFQDGEIAMETIYVNDAASEYSTPGTPVDTFVIGEILGLHTETAEFTPYTVKVHNPALYIFDGPGFFYNAVGVITDQGTYTIVEEAIDSSSSDSGTNLWGKLKSGDGWINLWEASISKNPDDAP